MIQRSDIVDLYQSYYKNREIELSLQNAEIEATDQQDWVDKIQDRRRIVRKLYIETEAKLNLFLRPLLEDENLLTDELASELYDQMLYYFNLNSTDGLLCIEVCQYLLKYYQKIKDIDHEIICLSVLARSYTRGGDVQDWLLAVELFEKLVQYADHFEMIQSEKAKLCVLHGCNQYLMALVNCIPYFYLKGKNVTYPDIVHKLDEIIETLTDEKIRNFYPNFDYEELIRNSKNYVFERYLFSLNEPNHQDGLCFRAQQVIEENYFSNLKNSELEIDDMTYYSYHKCQYLRGVISASTLVKKLYDYCVYWINKPEPKREFKNFARTQYYRVCMFTIPSMTSLLCLLNKEEQEFYYDYASKALSTFSRSISPGLINGYVGEGLTYAVTTVMSNSPEHHFDFRYAQDALICHNGLIMVKIHVVRRLMGALIHKVLENKPEWFIGAKGTKNVVEVLKQSSEIEKMIDEACMVYDLGMLSVTNIVQLQIRRLTKRELDIIYHHMVHGSKLVKNFISDRQIEDIILGHHKNYDGTGLPENFDSCRSPIRMIIEMIHLCDTLESATDMIGRSYQVPTNVESFLRACQNEDNRFSSEILDFILTDEKLLDEMSYICVGNRIQTYYEVYRNIIKYEPILNNKPKKKTSRRLEHFQSQAFSVLSKRYELIVDISTNNNMLHPLYVKTESIFKNVVECEFTGFLDRVVLPLVHIEDSSLVAQAKNIGVITDRIHQNNGVYEQVVRLIISNQYRWMRIQYSGVNGESGTIESIYMSIQDIDQIQRQQNQMMLALEVANEQAQKNSSAKTAFLSNMSHDIRTPLNAIVGFATLLQQYSSDTNRVQDYSQKIIASSNQLVELINDVLDVSKIESGKMDLNETENSIGEIINELVQINTPVLQQHHHDFKVDVKVKNDGIIVDKIRLVQILNNLLGNAIKYTPDSGHIKLSVKEKAEKSHLFSLYHIEISDDGIGMSEQFQVRAFEPFAREKNTTASHIQGTGLGLAIVKNLVDMMGGQISFTSEINKGTTFKLDLQFRVVKSEKAVSIDAKQEHQENILQGLTILAAEDNELNSEILCELLDMYGAKVDVAENGQLALQQLQENVGKYDLILMDIQMPVMNGYEATRAIRQLENPLLSQIPIIAMTANAFVDDIQASFDCGMNGHVPKPIDMNLLMKTIREVLIICE